MVVVKCWVVGVNDNDDDDDVMNNKVVFVFKVLSRKLKCVVVGFADFPSPDLWRRWFLCSYHRRVVVVVVVVIVVVIVVVVAHHQQSSSVSSSMLLCCAVAGGGKTQNYNLGPSVSLRDYYDLSFHYNHSPLILKAEIICACCFPHLSQPVSRQLLRPSSLITTMTDGVQGHYNSHGYHYYHFFSNPTITL